jgi:hypothetical protein
MPIVASEPPAKARRAVHDALASRAATAAFAPSKLQRADPHALFIAMPHRVAYLPAERIELGIDPAHAPQFLRQATQIRNWRFLVQEKRQRKAANGGEQTAEYESIAAATVATTDDENFELGDLNEGALVADTEYAIRFAETLNKVEKSCFEAFLLIAPGFYAAALWLQECDPNADIVLPIPILHPARDRRNTPDEFLRSLSAQQIHPV